MTGWIIFLILSLIMLAGLLFLSARFNESPKLLWAMLLLITVSVCSGRWHRQYMPHWNQVKFEHIMNDASSDNNNLKSQVTRYNHGTNAYTHHIVFNHYYKSSFTLGQAQDDVLHSTKKMMYYPIRQTAEPNTDFKKRRTIAKNAIRQLNRQKYMGQGYKADHIITGD